MEVSSVVLLLIALVTVIYYLIRKRYSYWSDLGVPYIKSIFPYGCLKGTGTEFHMAELLNKYYNTMKGKAIYCGVFFFINPVAVVLDLDFVKTILVKDFNYFMDRGVYFNEKDDPLSAHLFNIEGTKWRNLRAKLTPTFTSGKMKMMYPAIISIAKEFKIYMSKAIENTSEFEVKDIVARFTTDIIGTCAFGLECNSLKDPNAKFRQMGIKVFTGTKYERIRQFFMLSFRNLARTLHMTSFPHDVTSFFLQAVKDTIKYREENNTQRNDFMNLLMQLKSDKAEEESENKLSLTVEEIAAQAFVFFLAGFETSSTTMSFCLYELALNHEIQEKARQEVIAVLKKHNGEMTYEAACEMKYIDQIINETLRKYPPVPNLFRKVTKDYNVPGTNHVLKKGTTVLIPAFAIQRDPDIYPNPEEFNPDNFSDEAMANRSPFAFLSFGEGPRVCIGLRFGMMQTRIGLATLLLNFKFSSCSKSVIPIQISAKELFLAPVGGVWLNIVKI